MRLKCCVCGRVLCLHPQKKYIAKENLSGLAALSQSEVLWECVDCDICGCQNRLNKSFPKINIITEEEENDTNE